MNMKLDSRVQKYVEGKMGDNQNQMAVYQILIDGYWAGDLDMDPDKGLIILVDKPIPREATPAAAHISGAIMQAIVGGEKK